MAKYEYSSFGKMRFMTGVLSKSNPIRFSSRYMEGDSGIYYYGLRHYMARLQKWLSKDPIEEQGGFNLYAFVDSNPISSFDIYGLKCCGEKLVADNVICGSRKKCVEDALNRYDTCTFECAGIAAFHSGLSLMVPMVGWYGAAAKGILNGVGALGTWLCRLNCGRIRDNEVEYCMTHKFSEE